MQYKLQTKKGSFNLNASDVVNLLIGELVKRKRLDQEELATTFIEYLQANETLTNASLSSIAAMSFQIGYFYRIFCDKNNVTVVEEQNESDNPGTDQ